MANSAQRGDSDYVSPNDGGCWYCNRKDEGLSFCTEFDTFLHVDCIKDAISQHIPGSDDVELECIAKEFDLWPKEWSSDD